MNEPSTFFPFAADAEGGPVLLNKREVLVLTVPAEADRNDLPAEAQYPRRTVTIECEAQRLSGELAIELPEDHNRVLDYLNGPQRFLTLHDGDRDHLIQKERITRVLEQRGR